MLDGSNCLNINRNLNLFINIVYYLLINNYNNRWFFVILIKILIVKKLIIEFYVGKKKCYIMFYNDLYRFYGWSRCWGRGYR